MDQTVHLFPQQASSCRNGGTGDSSVSFQLGNRIKGGSTQNQALNALLFLYHQVLGKEIGYVNGVVRAKKAPRLPVVLTRGEIQALLSYLNGSEKIMATLLYGAGLRLMECCRLRVKDIDFSQNQIVVHAGKGDKDRYTMLPAAVKELLIKHLDAGKRQHQNDVEKNLGRVVLPNALDRKYPNAGQEWGWQWVFPATRYYVDRVTGRQYRHHLHESGGTKSRARGCSQRGDSKAGDVSFITQCFDIITTCSISLILSATLIVQR